MGQVFRKKGYKMVEISIICLIYKSKKLAKAVYDSLYEYTPKLKNGEAELLFVANDPTVELVDYLKSQNYPFIININEHLSEKELFKLGYGKPEYMRRVYQGYNQGVLNANGQKVVLINSDNFFSEDWLENLLKYSDYKTVVTSTLVEPGHEKFGVFPGAIQKNFGSIAEDYNDRGFQKFVATISKTGYTSGGAYMPCLLYKDIAILAGLYPEGNLADSTFDEIKRYGDESFYDSLKSFGVEHITAKDSVVYHLKEGEKSEGLGDKNVVNDTKYKMTGISGLYKVSPSNLIRYITPESRHREIMDHLGHKFSVIVLRFSNKDELDIQLKQIKNQNNKNFEITVLYDETNKDAIIPKHKNILYVYTHSTKKGTELYRSLHGIYGEYLLISDAKCEYKGTLFDQEFQNDKITYFGNDVSEQDTINDSIGNFIIPKSVLLGNLNMYIEMFFQLGNVEIERIKCEMMAMMVPELDVIVVEDDSDINNGPIAIIKGSLPYRVARKLYRKGPKNTIKAVLDRVRRK